MIINWDEFLLPYHKAVKELINYFEEIKNESSFSPIEHVEGRVKRVSSILHKIAKKELIKEHIIEDIETKLDDIVGIRIVCNFMYRIDEVIDIIRKCYDKFEVIEERDYLTNYKESGYRSYHIIIKYITNTKQGRKLIKAEIQIRPMAMDFWAKLEHTISYKFDSVPEDIKWRLTQAAKTAFKLDKELGSIYRDIGFNFQRDNKPLLLEEIQNNIIKLYKINKVLAVKYNSDFLTIYNTASTDILKNLNSNIISEIGD